jgi:Cu(I)/Ag(I) efflux system membrane fusion protein
MNIAKKSLLRICLILLSCMLLQAPLLLAAESDAGHKHDAETIWTCSMHPQIQLPESGQCPICFMDLIEVVRESAEGQSSLRQISFDSRARKLAAVEVQAVRRGETKTEIRMVGKVDYDETRVSTITSWVNGRIDKLFVDYTGSQVDRGQPMVKVYSPELLTAQAELIQSSEALKRTESSGNEIIRKTASRTLVASREKLRLLGLSDTQLAAIEQQGQPTDHITLTAPQSGIVIKKDVNEGMYVKTGSPIYTLADLGRVWVVLEAYESDIEGIRLGQQVRFSVESYPGTPFQGEVAYIDPLVNSATRTVRVRLNVDNGDAKLKPGMFVRAVSSANEAVDPGQRPLLIPASAPLVTGKRALVYVQKPDEPGVYVGKEVVLGARQGDFYQVKHGLQEGELVVTRGNFKIDSAIQLQAGPSMMNPYFVEEPSADATYPSLFVSRLNILNREFALFSKELHKGSTWQSSLETFQQALAKVSDAELQGDDQLSWRELSMLIGSDIVLLNEADDRAETEQLYGVLSEHFHQIRTRFQLSDVEDGPAQATQLAEQVSRLLRPYLALQKSLAADAIDAARKESQLVASEAQNMIKALQGSGDEQGNAFAASLAVESTKLSAAVSMADIRAAFYPFSKTLADMVGIYGSSDEAPLFVQFCPMAFGNSGATWIAGSEEINNPYFGAMMLRCGEVKKQLK